MCPGQRYLFPCYCQPFREPCLRGTPYRGRSATGKTDHLVSLVLLDLLLSSGLPGIPQELAKNTHFVLSKAYRMGARHLYALALWGPLFLSPYFSLLDRTSGPVSPMHPVLPFFCIFTHINSSTKHTLLYLPVGPSISQRRPPRILGTPFDLIFCLNEQK